MGEDGWGAGDGDAGEVGGSRGCYAGGIVAGTEVVCWFWVVVDGESGCEWSEGDVVEVGVGAAGAEAVCGVELVSCQLESRVYCRLESTNIHGV